MRRRTLPVLIAAALLGLGAAWPARAADVGDFFRAIMQDNDSAMRRLLDDGIDPNSKNEKGVPGLNLALSEDSLKVARVLLASRRLKPEQRSRADESPLMIAALKGDLDIAKRLIELGADVNKPGWTPLHYAATHGHLKIMALLLEENAFIDAQAPNGDTPLMMAAVYGTPEAVKLLIEADADIHMRNNAGLTALDLAQRAERRNAVDLLVTALRRAQGVPRGQW